MDLDEETQPMASKEKPPQSELDRPTGHVVGDGLVKIFFGLVSTGLIAFGVWMWNMYDTQRDLSSSTQQLSFKLDLLTQQLAEAKQAGAEAEGIARDNSRRLDRIEATRFTEQDAQKTIAPLENRIERLESGRRR